MRPKTFRQIINAENDIKAIVDDYKTKIPHGLWMAEGLQKDAIQNSWDARIDKENGKKWECGFSLINLNDKQLLCIIDRGTTGLNGTKFKTEKELLKILNTNKPGEDLAYFLNSNWSAKTSEAGGNRGRGKTLFLAASKEKQIFFDSFRSIDNTYVFGKVYLDKDKQIKFEVYYDEEAKKRFKNLTKKHVPLLNHHGTRVFILSPHSSVIKAIASGEMLSFIANSRWEIIKKHQAKIFIDDSSGKKYTSLPYWYEDKLKNVKVKEFFLDKIKEGTEYKVKKLVLRYAPDLNLPESARGIAIQRGGMTIQRILPEELVHEDGVTNIYGWVEMDKSLEEEMKNNCEGPEHLDFSWSINPAKLLRDYIRYKLREFAKELNIIDSEQTQKNRIQKTAEEEASKYLIPIFKKLKLFGKHKGNKQRKKTKRRPNEPLRLSITDLKFPRENRRVNYGDIIKGTYVIPINDLDKDVSVLVQVFILLSNGKKEIIQEKEIILRPGQGEKIGTENITISKKYEKGGYSFKAAMISLEDLNIVLPDGSKIEKGTILYGRVNQKFYIEMDPPESGPFNFQPKPKDKKDYLFDWEPEEESGYIIFYNDLHPRIKGISNNFEELTNYFIEQGILIALQIKLEESIAEKPSKDEDDKAFYSLIKSKRLEKVWPVILGKYSEFLWDLKENNGN